MILERQPMLEVVQHCLEKRGGSLLWNRSFQRQLCDLAQEHGLLGPRPPNYNYVPMEEKKPAPPPAHHCINAEAVKRDLVQHLESRLAFDAAKKRELLSSQQQK